MPEQLIQVLPVGRKLYSRSVYLRRLTKKDAKEFRGLLIEQKDYLNEWMPHFPDRITEQMACDWIAEEHLLARRGERLDLGLFDISSSQLLGRIALHSISYGIQRSAGMSYWINPAYSGKGFTTEAAATMVSFAFEELQLHRLWLNITPDNLASIAICQKLGFRREGEHLKSLFLNKVWKNAVIFALLEEEYDKLADQWIKKKIMGT